MLTPLRLLMIEDSESDANLVRHHLEKAGFELTYERVETAEDMQLALEQQTWDIIISDYSLPEFSAPAALAILQQTHLDIPFIITSGTISEETALDLMRGGAADYLMKDRLARLGVLVKRELNIKQVRRERHEARVASLESDLRFRTLSEQSPYGVLIIDCVTTLPIEFNTMAHTQLGYTREEFAGLRICDYEAAENPEEIKSHIQKISIHLKSEFETRHRTKLGTTRIIHVYVQLIELSGKKVFYSIYQDITERKLTEEALKEDELLQRTILQTTKDGFCILDARGHITDSNEAYCEMTGYSQAELYQLGISDLDSLEDPAATAARMKRIIN